MQENTLREEWRSLTSVIGQPDMPMATVAGDLEHGWPELNEEEAVEAITKQSPAVQIAETAAVHAQVAAGTQRGANRFPIFRFAAEWNTTTNCWKGAVCERLGGNR